MSNVERTHPHPGTAQAPRQRDPYAPPGVPRQRGSGPTTVPRRFDVHGNRLVTPREVLVLQNTSHTSGRAIASLVLGLLSLAIGGPILGVPAMLFSISADGQIARGRGRIGGSASARVGFWTGVIGSLAGIYVFFLVLAMVGIAVPVPRLE